MKSQFKLIIRTALALGLFSGSLANAQEVGALLGFHNVSASTDTAGTSIESKVNFRAGTPIAFELVDKMKFRTGFIYTQRHFDAKSSTATQSADFDYIDLPATAQFKINEMFGFYGGLNMGINVRKKVGGNDQPGTAAILPFLTVGATTLFNDMVGFEFYYERSMGKVADHLSDYSIFGASFVYWIY